MTDFKESKANIHAFDKLMETIRFRKNKLAKNKRLTKLEIECFKKQEIIYFDQYLFLHSDLCGGNIF